jgi:hypothetical protein
MDVFLSASVPLPTRHKQFYETADIIAIRDAVKALALTVLTSGRLIFGGHPAITPLLSLVIREMFPERAGSVVLYQSDYFKGALSPLCDTRKSLFGPFLSLPTGGFHSAASR